MTLTEPSLDLDAATRSPVRSSISSTSSLAAAFLATMGGPRVVTEPILIEPADAAGIEAHRRLRALAFVDEQHLFESHDLDEVDADPASAVALVRGLVGLSGPRPKSGAAPAQSLLVSDHRDHADRSSVIARIGPS